MTEQREDDDINESLGLFEAALHAKAMDLPPPVLSKLLVVLDGSDQDSAAMAFGAALGDRLLIPISTREKPAGTCEVNGAAQPILDAAAKEAASLIVLPAPFGDDLHTLEDKSLSVTIDMLLLNSPLPLFVVRDSMEAPAEVLKRPLVLTDWHPERQAFLGSWGAHFARGGNLFVLAVPDPEVLEAIAHLAGDDEEGVEMRSALVDRAETRLAGSLIAALQRKGQAEDFEMIFEVKVGMEPAAEAARLAEAEDRFIICAYKKSRGSASLGHAHATILRSRVPVLAIGL
ncbi:MAG: hypothetical protein V3W41_03055 [Planctomycetota bacterium]